MPRRGLVAIALSLGLLALPLAAPAGAAVTDDPHVRLVSESGWLPSVTPDGRYVLFDDGGLVVADGETGASERLPNPEPGTWPQPIGLSADAARVVSKTERDGGVDIRVTERATGTSRLAARVDAPSLGGTWLSADARTLLYTLHDSAQTYPWDNYVVDLTTGARRQVEGRWAHLASDGSAVVYVADLGTDRDGVYRLDLQTGASQLLAERSRGWAVVLDATPDGRTVVVGDSTGTTVVGPDGTRAITTPDGVDLRGAPGLTEIADDGSVVALAAGTGSDPARMAYVWDGATGETRLVSADAFGTPYRVDAVALSGDGGALAFVTESGSALRYDVATGERTLVCCRAERQHRVHRPRIDATGATIVVDPFWEDEAGQGHRAIYRWDAVVRPTGTPPSTLTVSGGSALESSGRLTWQLDLDRASAQPVTVPWQVDAGTAVEGEDFAAAAGAVTFAPGQVTATVGIDLVDDDIAEGDESVALRVDAGDLTVVGPTVGTIVEDDAPPAVTIDDASGPEATMELRFRVRLDHPTDEPVLVDWATTASTGGPAATPDVDFRAGRGQVVIPAGSSSATIRVSMIDEDLDEPDEGFALAISSDAAVGRASATGTIVDDDWAPYVRVEDARAAEDHGPMAWVVSLSAGRSIEPITVRYRIFQDTSAPDDREAKAGRDFTAAEGTITIPAGERGAIVGTSLIDDVLPEKDEWFAIELSALTGPATMGRAKAIGVINDDESATIWGLLQRP